MESINTKAKPHQVSVAPTKLLSNQYQSFQSFTNYKNLHHYVVASPRKSHRIQLVYADQWWRQCKTSPQRPTRTTRAQATRKQYMKVTAGIHLASPSQLRTAASELCRPLATDQEGGGEEKVFLVFGVWSLVFCKGLIFVARGLGRCVWIDDLSHCCHC